MRNGDRWRQAVNAIRIWLFQMFQELARLRRKALEVPPLPLGEQRVQRQARLAAAAYAANGNELAMRYIEIDAFEIVNSYAA